MKIEELRITQKVRHGHDVAMIVALDLRTNFAMIQIGSERYKQVSIKELQKHELDLPTKKEIQLIPEEQCFIGLCNINLLKLVLRQLHAGNAVFGRHECLGEIKAVMNMQKNRISIYPMDDNAKKHANRVNEQELCHHVLFYPWKWFIIEKYEEI